MVITKKQWNLLSEIDQKTRRCQKNNLLQFLTFSVLAVVGAGRGPLVDRALQAAKAAGRQIEVFAVEKNPHAFIGYATRHFK